MHVRCVLCPGPPLPDWGRGSRTFTTFRQHLDYAAHLRLSHPVMADWVHSRFAPISQN